MSETAKKTWRPGFMTWLIIGGILLINASVFVSGDDPQATHRFLHHLDPCHWPVWYAVNLWLVFFGLLATLILRNCGVQAAWYSFYSSRLWQSVKTGFKKNKTNQALVYFILRRKFGKGLLRKWLTFWKNIKIERYPDYACAFTLIVISIVFFIYAGWMETPRYYLRYFWMLFRHSIFYHLYVPFYLGPLVEYNMGGTITWRLFIAPATGLLLILLLFRLASKAQKKKKRRVT